MSTISNIFTKSPFKLLNEHMQKVSKCIEQVEPLINHFIQGEFEAVKKLGKEISKKEHEADIIKDEIREHLPKSILMPVSREDVLKLLHRKDNIADFCEDLSVLLSVRNTKVIQEIRTDFEEFVKLVVETVNETIQLTQKIHELMETSFSGPSAERVLTMIENVGQMEWRSDKKKFELVQNMFSHEDKIDPVSLVLFLKIFDVISGMADSAENAANALRLMVSK